MIDVVPHQYKPFNHQIGQLPLIVYPVKSAGDLRAVVTGEAAIRRHLDELYQKYDEIIGRGLFHIVFVWTWRGLLMVDVWVQQVNTLGPDVAEDVGVEKCVTFKNRELYDPVGIASGNTMVVLGREQEHRWKFDSLDEYLDRSKSMPDFPDGFAPVDEF